MTGVVFDDGVPPPPTPSPTPPPTTEVAQRAAATEARRRWAVASALLVVTGFGASLRAHGFTRLGLWRDDAWVALSAKVGLGSAWHMWVTAPGAFLIDRTVLVVSPGGATWWAQLPAFVAGVAAIPAVYLLVRWFRLSRVAGLAAASFVCVAPFCITYSTRVKEFELDLLMACLLLALGEWARRSPGRRPLVALAVASVAAFFCSASLAPVIAGVWLAVALFAWRDDAPGQRRRVVAAGVAAGAGGGLVALAFYRQISPTTRLLWPGAFIRHGSVGAFGSSVGSTTWHLIELPMGLDLLATPWRVALVVGWLAVMAAGLRGNRAMVAPALAVGVAYVLSAADLSPLGTGRSDQYLYPALLLLTAAGATRLLGAAVRAGEGLTRLEMRTIAAIGIVLVVVLTTARVGEDIGGNRPVYPGVDVRGLSAQIRAHERPGDHIVVSELMRYPWALAEEATPDLRFGTEWATGFTVVSTDPSVFIVPSEYYEGDSHPKAWAARTAGLHRLWYVWSPPLSVDPSYWALRADGWRPVTTLEAPGAVATLLER